MIFKIHSEVFNGEASFFIDRSGGRRGFRIMAFTGLGKGENEFNEWLKGLTDDECRDILNWAKSTLAGQKNTQPAYGLTRCITVVRHHLLGRTRRKIEDRLRKDDTFVEALACLLGMPLYKKRTAP